ncbi:MAG: DNA gyrase/topoisomerase IV subunit A [Bacteroidetes bacterium]|nr:DNA gyrase/topoisomerase IV subunit A [Bacteroidota bacterium]MCL2302661.1 DNA gyrase/topoisomerase IV subunit A [Lentimicrobiaceae bacterium]
MTEEEIVNEPLEDPQETSAISDNVAQTSDLHKVIFVPSMFENYFLDYASYVILDRAVPDIYDGLKPVQRRILHSMNELEDGRYNKAANVIGNTMKYHPHGDTSIGDAMVQLGQKDITIDTQGNWGNIFTGDDAAAPRYIEARLTKFALEVAFNSKTTEWKMSYDGRNKEPIALPMKFPLLLAQGVEGIAVGLATKILPHNFIELIDASIAILENRDFEIYPDFPTGGTVDVSKYNEGVRGGKIRNRAKITIVDKKILVIHEIPYGTTTTSLITNSIAPAIEKGKLKIKKIDDNTAEKVEILLHLQPGVSPDQTIDALYAFTDCEMSYSPNACVICNRKPQFMSVKEILRTNTENTVTLLKRELEIELAELEEDWHKWSLEKIFFEKRIYKELEKDTATWEKQIENIEKAFDPYRDLFRREITREDVLKLCEKPVRKISKFDIKQADEKIAQIEDKMDQVLHHLNHLIEYAINYFENLKKKYGEGRERKTEIKSFDNIVAATVAVANQKLYVNKKEGFVGTALKKDEEVEYVCDCSDIDEIVVFRDNGIFLVSKVSEKQFFGKDIIHVEVFKRNDDRTVYNMVYADGYNGMAMVKRFSVGGVTRDKEYDLTKGTAGTKVLYFTSNPNGEAEKVRVLLKAKAKLKKTQFDFDFSTLAIKGRASQGNILSRNPVRKIEIISKGVSTLSAINIYYDPIVMRLNSDERGDSLGAFKEDDKIISIYKNGNYRITGFDLSTHFEDNLCIIQKLNSQKPITAVYENKEDGKFYMKRFIPEPTDKKVEFLGDEKTIRPIFISYDHFPQIEVEYYEKKPEEIEKTIIFCTEFVEIMSLKARGKRIAFKNIVEITALEPLPEPEEEIIEDVGAENLPPLEDKKQKEESNEEVFEEEEEIQVPEVLIVPTENEKEATEETPIAPKEPIKNTKEDEEWEQLTLF